LAERSRLLDRKQKKGEKKKKKGKKKRKLPSPPLPFFLIWECEEKGVRHELKWGKAFVWEVW
jgi:hypothetical protein